MSRSHLMIALVVAAGCGFSTQYKPTNPSPHPLRRRDPATVAVFTASGMPRDRPYVEIGILQTRAADTAASMPDVLDAMRAAAAEIGCDAVVVNGASPAVGGSDGASTFEGYWGACIVYRDQSAPLSSAADLR